MGLAYQQKKTKRQQITKREAKTNTKIRMQIRCKAKTSLDPSRDVFALHLMEYECLNPLQAAEIYRMGLNEYDYRQ